MVVEKSVTASWGSHHGTKGTSEGQKLSTELRLEMFQFEPDSTFDSPAEAPVQ